MSTLSKFLVQGSLKMIQQQSKVRLDLILHNSINLTRKRQSIIKQLQIMMPR